MLAFTRSASPAIYGRYSNSPQPGQDEAQSPSWQPVDGELPVLEYTGARSCSRTTGAFKTIAQGGFAAIIGEPYWINDQLRDTATESGHAAALIQGYFTYGLAVLDQLRGGFALALVDEASSRLVVAVDRLGRYPMYYSECEGSVLFGSTGSSLTARSHSDQLDGTGLYNYVYFHMVPSPLSIYPGIRKLAPGHSLVVDKNHCHVRTFWSPNFGAITTESFPAAGETLRSTLRNSVSRAVQSEPSVAAFLSGGLDSSTVAGMLAELSDQQAHAYAIGFEAQGYDEMPYARLTARHFGIELHEYYVTPDDIVAALPKIAANYDEPFGNSSALPAYFCAKLAAKNGVKRLLAGDGGDELFAGNERYAKQSIFNTYARIPEAIRKSVIEPILHHLPQAMPLVSKARSYVAQANTPLPERLQSYNFLHRIEPGEIFDDGLLSGIDPGLPLELQRQRYLAIEQASELDRMLFFDWKFTLADNDLRKVSQMCALAGVQVAYPMLDDELLEFSCTIPDAWKLKGSKLRYFYKESLRGWLPDETLQKRKHGFGLPFGVWMQDHKPLQALAYDSLSSLKRRGFFKPAFIEKTIDLHRIGHAAYYGELIWILMVLELWLRGRTADA